MTQASLLRSHYLLKFYPFWSSVVLGLVRLLFCQRLFLLFRPDHKVVLLVQWRHGVCGLEQRPHQDETLQLWSQETPHTSSVLKLHFFITDKQLWDDCSIPVHLFLNIKGWAPGSTSDTRGWLLWDFSFKSMPLNIRPVLPFKSFPIWCRTNPVCC